MTVDSRRARPAPAAPAAHERAPGARAPFTAGIHRRHFDILRGGQMGQQMVALKDKAKVFPPQTGQRIAIQLRDIRFPPPDRCRWWVCRGSQGYSSASIFPSRRPRRSPPSHPHGCWRVIPFRTSNAAVAGRIAATYISQLKQRRHFAAPLALSPTITSSPSSRPCTTATSVSLRSPMITSRSLTSPVRNSRTW